MSKPRATYYSFPFSSTTSVLRCLRGGHRSTFQNPSQRNTIGDPNPTTQPNHYTFAKPDPTQPNPLIEQKLNTLMPRGPMHVATQPMSPLAVSDGVPLDQLDYFHIP